MEKDIHPKQPLWQPIGKSILGIMVMWFVFSYSADFTSWLAGHIDGIGTIFSLGTFGAEWPFQKIGVMLLSLIWVLSMLRFRKPPLHVKYNSMPQMRPIPIKTRNVFFLVALKRWLFDFRRWKLIEDWECELGGEKIIIPKGFKFDGASVPRPFWILLNPIGLLLMPGLLHDYAYRNDKLEKPDGTAYKEGAGKTYWDKLFLRAAVDINGFRFLNTLASYAMVVGGYFTWWSYKNDSWKSKASWISVALLILFLHHDLIIAGLILAFVILVVLITFELKKV